MNTLSKLFQQLSENYTNDQKTIDQYWSELKSNYTASKRHYHTLTHLEDLFTELSAVKSQIQDWNTILFTLFFHDAVYDASRGDNEERSAELAVSYLNRLNVPAHQVMRCEKQILATKHHVLQTDPDTNLFTDADLSVLGREWSAYEDYTRQVRREYRIYPDLLYKPGRRKVLEHFIAMERIFKTPFFFEKYEKQARENIQRELELL